MTGGMGVQPFMFAQRQTLVPDGVDHPGSEASAVMALMRICYNYRVFVGGSGNGIL